MAILIVLLSMMWRQEAEFPGIPWGAPLLEVQRAFTLEPAAGVQSEPAADEGSVERYRYRLDALGKARISECLLEFTAGRFSGIILTTQGLENTHTLHDYLTGRFGKGSDDGHRFWQWLSEETYVSLDEDSAGDGYVLWYGIRWQSEK